MSKIKKITINGKKKMEKCKDSFGGIIWERQNLSEGGYRFKVSGTGIGFGMWFGLVFIGGLIGVFFNFGLETTSWAPVLSGIGVMIGIGFFINMDRARTFTFDVTDNNVIVRKGSAPDKNYAKSNIQSITLKNVAGKTVASTGPVKYIGGGFGPEGYALAAGAQMMNFGSSVGSGVGNAMAESRQARGFSVRMGIEDREVTLAQHLEEGPAKKLMESIVDSIQS